MKPYYFLIPSDDLFTILNDPGLVIFDCRFDLLNPKQGREDYLKEHIKGAVFADLNDDLSDKPSRTTGNHPLPDSTQFNKFLSDGGMDSNKQVVVYDSVGGSFSVRLWWLLKQYGHDRVAILDGGFPSWKQKDYPVKSGLESHQRANFKGDFQSKQLISIKELEKLLETDDNMIIDSRSPERFRGEIEPLYPIAGHIPKSINWFFQNNLTSEGKFKPRKELLDSFHKLLGSHKPNQLIFYCGSGVTSLLNIFTLEMLGFPGSRVYIGSWSEWIKHHPDNIEKK